MINSLLKKEYGISDKIIEIDGRVISSLSPYFEKIDKTTRYNQVKTLAAFKNCKIREPHFAATTGYGYDDLGRDAIEELYAQVFEAEDALVRHSIISGTQALSICLFGVLRPGDRLVSLTGKPYDTLQQVIGGEGVGSLKDFGVNYSEVSLKDGKPDYDAIRASITDDVKMVLIQRSKGYEWRDTLSVSDIENIIKTVKSVKGDVCCFVDNCYGEFTEEKEPTAVGADLMAGSLIKNPGGGIARGGAYIAGKKNYVELASYRYSCIGQGKEVGPTFGFNREILQGFFMAPHITAQALKVAVYCGGVFKELGFDICPSVDALRGDIIQAVKFNDKDLLVAFCQGIQKGAPIDAYITPEPWAMPGYEDEVIMAAGAFTQGSTTELSADAPIKAPYVGYMQGSLDFECGRVGIMVAADNVLKTMENK